MSYSKITISGKICTGKSTLIGRLQKILGWPVIHSGSIFRDIAKKKKLDLLSAEEQNSQITRKVDDTVKKAMGKPGNLLVDAWLGGILAIDIPDVLTVLLTAESKTRYERFAKREQISIAKAREQVMERDKSWLEKVSVIYGRNDFFKPSHYKLILDTTRMSPEMMADCIIQKIRK